jgi:hypothetical protein
MCCFAAAENDAPSFTSGLAKVSVDEDSGLHKSAWARNISPAPEEAGQTVTFSVTCSNPALFAADAAPQISATGEITFTPAANMHGTSDCSVILADSAGAKSEHVPLNIEVTAGEYAWASTNFTIESWLRHS